MIKRFFLKFKTVALIAVVTFITNSDCFAVVFNDDIQKIPSDVVYFEGFEQDKIIHDTKKNTWYIEKPDNSIIKLNGNYIDYEGIAEGKYYKFNDDYYRFVIKNESYSKDKSTRFIYVDKNGLECLIKGYSYVYPTMNEKYYVVINANNKGLYYKYNKSLIIPALYNDLIYVNDNKIIACKNNKYGILNIKQQSIIPFEYNYFQYINDNFIIASKDGVKYGVININNSEVLPFEYDEIYTSSWFEGCCKIVKDNKSGLIDISDSHVVIPLEYDDVLSFEDELVIAQNNNKQGIIDLNKKEIVPFIYDSIMSYGDYFIAYKNGLAGLLSKSGTEILPFNYISITEIKNNFITAVLYDENYERKYAVYDVYGNEIVPPIYDYVNYYASDNYMIVKNNGFSNLINKLTGTGVLSSAEYEDIKYINDKYFAAGNENSYNIFNFAGQKLTNSCYGSITTIKVDNEELIAAELKKSELPRETDYFKQTKGPSSWAVAEVTKSLENNLVPVNYQSAFTFNITRTEFCSLIIRFMEQKNNTTIEEIINENNIDVINPNITDGFNDEIAVCHQLGIVNGRGNGIFDGESEITREEAAVILTNLAKYIGLNTNTENVIFKDEKIISSWAKNSVNYVLENNIMNGTGSSKFSPKSNLTKEQSYIIMYRMFCK